MHLLDKEKRWLEIIFYLICNKIFNINNNLQDIIDFINGYQWTNMVNCDIIIDTLTKDKILLDTTFIPTKHEFYVGVLQTKSILHVPVPTLKELTKDTPLAYYRSAAFHIQLKEEINPTELHPKLTKKGIHEQLYRFLLALKYISDIIKTIKL